MELLKERGVLRYLACFLDSSMLREKISTQKICKLSSMTFIRLGEGLDDGIVSIYRYLLKCTEIPPVVALALLFTLAPPNGLILGTPPVQI